ncbi:hypothetical protein [Haloplanus halophilus]|uniref:hypothetical protein n=1 Tax=Haloplanus halophilus TaxID=2949993 RepID=UPI00203E2FF3|nr:hypothetical protein [Haloplanus sp. GDY1]
MRVRELPKYRDWLSALFLGFALVAGVVGSLIANIYGATSTSSLKSLATALLTGKTAIFAVAFTVTLIGVELKSSELSSRVSWIFTRVWIFRRTFQVFTLALLLDIVCLLAASSMTPWQRTSAAAVISMASAVTLLMIYFYLIEAIEKLTPSGVIDIFLELLTPRTYISEVAERDGRVVSGHPLDGLFDVVVELNESDEDKLAELSLEKYFEIVGEVMEYSLYVPSDDLRLQQFLVPHINHSGFFFLDNEAQFGAGQPTIVVPEQLQFYEVLTVRYNDVGADLFRPVYESHLSELLTELPQEKYENFYDEMDVLMETATENRSKLLVEGLFEVYWMLHDDTVSSFAARYEIESRIISAIQSCVMHRGLVVAGNQLRLLADSISSDRFCGEDLFALIELYTTKSPNILSSGLSWHTGEAELLRHRIRNPERHTDVPPDAAFIIAYNNATARIIHTYYVGVKGDSGIPVNMLVEYLKSNIKAANESALQPEVEFLIEQFVHTVCLFAAQTTVDITPEDELLSLIDEEAQFEQIINREVGKLSRAIRSEGLSGSASPPELHIAIPEEDIDRAAFRKVIRNLRSELTKHDQQAEIGSKK